MVADAMANIGVEREFSFHVETKEDEGKTQQIWSGCFKVAEEDVRLNVPHYACEWQVALI